jgi:hypothetical protein
MVVGQRLGVDVSDYAKGDAPHRVAVVQNKSELGKLLTVLSRSADIIDDGEPDERIRKLALAA